MFEIGTKIYRLRLEKRLTQRELAARAGVYQANLSNVEKGKQDLTVSTLLRLCSALEVDPAEVFKKEKRRAPLRLTRVRVERLAKGVWDPRIKLSPKEKALKGLLSTLIPEVPKRRVSDRRVYEAWQTLKGAFGPNEIRLLTEKVREKKLH